MLYGELGAILNWIERQAIGKAAQTKTPAALATGVSVSMVAGAGHHHNLRFLVMDARLTNPGHISDVGITETVVAASDDQGTRTGQDVVSGGR
jgi:hypothetical protein